MHTWKKSILISLTGLFLIVATGMAMLSIPGQTKSATGQKQRPEVIEDPIVDYSASEPADPTIRAKMGEKNSRYDKGKPETVKELDPGISPLPLIVHWWRDIPAIPVEQSDAILIGKVEDAQAHLSNDKTGIYSEFIFSIEEVLKGNNSTLVAGGTVTAERLGGAVRFASGQVQKYSILGQGKPGKGRRYLIFLKHDNSTPDYSILTGYELRAGQIFPLDGEGVNGGGKLPYDAYTGTGETAFINNVRDAVANNRSIGQ